MVKIARQTRIYTAQMLLEYKGNNKLNECKKVATTIKIKEFKYNHEEELVVQHTLFDGTEILFSMISGSLYLKKERRFQLLEGQNYCDFELYLNDGLFVFDGGLFTETLFNENYNYRENYTVTIIMQESIDLLQTWIKYNQRIITN